MRFPRSSGVLVHITSLPGPHGSGDMGASAYQFVDWLVTAGQTLWQILPLGGIGPGYSPYMSSSAFAGNVLLIDLTDLQARGWLTSEELAAPIQTNPAHIDFDQTIEFRMSRLQIAARRFDETVAAEDHTDFTAFCDCHADWLDDYALFMALAEHADGQCWCDWDAPLAHRHPGALSVASKVHENRVHFWKFSQWCFFRQWACLKAYANAKGVRIIGDVPIFVAHQSADTWSHPELFELDCAGRPNVVAGVPPDAFSQTGQLWGNPLYRWVAHAAEQYVWWITRIRRIFELVDIVRIDHFRGFEACWQVDVEEVTAINGRWVGAPGDDLFTAITAALGHLPIVAEDLGVITPDVDQLRRKHEFPGMSILQFAWNENCDSQSRYLPHNHTADTVVYTGSHDNDTSAGWWESVDEHVKHHLREYLTTDGQDISWELIRVACASVADMAIYPMQDVLQLCSEHRMNLPGSTHGNWTWRFEWLQVNDTDAARLQRMCKLYGRLPQVH
jgi:4-alpha-glucanotransferase